jgi:dihydrolipoamide dehydrogenase
LEGRYAAKVLAKANYNALDYSNMSTLMFFKPEVAAVGMNEKMLRQRKMAYKVAWYSNAMVNRTIAMRSTTGFVKIMISDDKEQRILGMRAAGPQASAFIASIAHFINQGNMLKEVMQTIFPHPSVTEGIQECLRLFENKSIFKPKAFPEYIRVDSWKPDL